MSCFHPLTAYKDTQGQIRFDEKSNGDPFKLPCGQCIGCRLERSRQWAMRITHEASLHQDNCFITLTYNDENIPLDGSLKKSDFQKFMKDLRYHCDKQDKKIKFYMCGEYGDNTNRPHYHAIIFGFNFRDWVYLFDSTSGEPIYTSPTLEKIWKKGFVTIGTVSFESAGYVARYCMKKINGPLKDQISKKTGLKPYERIHPYTGEIIEVVPEYSTMSRGGTNGRGIAYDWFTRFRGDCYPKDYTTIRGMRMQPPKYYDEQLRQIDPDMYDDIKSGRSLSMNIMQIENKGPALSARETVKKAQFNQLKRSL